MTRDTATISMMLGAGFSTLATTITQLSVYDGGLGLYVLLPVVLGGIIAVDELDVSIISDGHPHISGDLPANAPDEEKAKVADGGDPDA